MANASLSRQEALSSERVKLYHATLENAINNLEHLPLVVAKHQTVISLLNDTENEEALSQTRHYLKTVNDASDSAVVYILNKDGKTVASSNWRNEKSFEGKNYGFRPYFQDAIKGKEGRFFAVGATTGRPGYFISRPVYSSSDKKKIIGVAVVKIELEALQEAWRHGGENILVLNEDGIVVLSSNKNWLFKALNPLQEAQRKRIQENKTFAKLRLNVLDLTQKEQQGNTIFSTKKEDFLVQKALLGKPAWAIYYLAPLSGVETIRLLTLAFSLGGLSLSFLLFLYQRGKMKQDTLQREAEEGRRIRLINMKLEQEIKVRKKAESRLTKMQGELVLAGKMAALGKMSAAIAHEVSQPVAAIKTFASSGKVLLGRNQIDEAQKSLDDIIEVTQRLSAISGDLKLFARTRGQEGETILIYPNLERVLKTFKSVFNEKGITLELQGFQQPIAVFCPRYRLEQVFSNIVQNALDAMEGVEKKKKLAISMKIYEKQQDKRQVILHFLDNGRGIKEEVLENLFAPFVTTKPVKQGVGLGLAISYGLVEEMGGSLRAKNHADGGALFSISLPIVNEMKEVA